MATYKKRGYKPKANKEKQAEEELESTTAGVFNTLNQGVSKTEQWIQKNQNIIIGAIGTIALVVLGYLSYNTYILEPKQEEAVNEMYMAKSYFDDAVNGTSSDSLFTKSLNGTDDAYGMLDIIKQYSGTKAANLANYYAGMAYFNLKDYKNAITYLSEFNSNDKMLNPLAKGTIGDAFVQLQQPDEALYYYKKAFKANTNNFTTPLFLMKAARISMDLKQFDKALIYLNRIKEEFSASDEAREIDTLIGNAEAHL